MTDSKKEFIVRGLASDGTEVFYTGRAGNLFVSTVRNESFIYDSQEAARTRAKNLNRATQLHGIWFIAISYNEVCE